MAQVHRTAARRGAARRAALLCGALGLALWLVPEALAQTRPAMTAELFGQLTSEQKAAYLAEQARANQILMGLFLLFVAAVTAGLFLYAHWLHRSFLKVCAETQQIALFAQMPGGLPVGTIRGLIAVFIVLTSAGLILLTVKGGPFEGFPEVMAGVLGTVLGFYFGSRTASGAGERGAAETIAEVSRQRNAAVTRAEATRLERAVATVREGLAVAKAVKEALPESLRRPAETVIGRVEAGLRTVDALQASGDVGGAVEKAAGLAADLRREAGLAGLLARAAGSFGAALGGSAPPLALAVAVATVAARLTGAAYERWTARVLDAPYTPALFPPAVIDANTGLVLLRKSPRFAEAFAEEIRRGDRAFILDFLAIALSEAGSEAIRDKYPGRFQTLQEIDAALQQFQQAAIELEVAKDISADMAAEIGGVDPLMRALDRINAHPDARADLDALMLALDGLRRSDQPVERLVREARKEVEG